MEKHTECFVQDHQSCDLGSTDFRSFESQVRGDHGGGGGRNRGRFLAQAEADDVLVAVVVVKFRVVSSYSSRLTMLYCS